MRTEKTINIIANNRREIRNQLIAIFLEEEPGLGIGELCSHYKYFVETLSDGNRVFLKRPAPLNKGFDFGVNIENINFGIKRKITMPSHNSILNDLKLKKVENQKLFIKLIILIDNIYNCIEVEKLEYQDVIFKNGHSTEIILKAVKWLFIEQDMTYWNWTGRNMLYGKIKEI